MRPNIYFGRIGDVWKHLLLLEVMAAEKPNNVWESHSASAKYPLIHSYQRDYGVYYFCKYTPDAPLLKQLIYTKLLDSLVLKSQYPGSPLAIMNTLQNSKSSFVFCDVNNDCLTNINENALELGIESSRINLYHGDGLKYINQLSKCVSATETLVHIDPYNVLEEQTPGLNSLNLFLNLSKLGFRCILWYRYENIDEQNMYFNILCKLAELPMKFWCADVKVLAANSQLFISETDITHFGVITSNLSDQSMDICNQFSKEFERIYSTAKFPDGQSGAINYSSSFFQTDTHKFSPYTNNSAMR